MAHVRGRAVPGGVGYRSTSERLLSPSTVVLRFRRNTKTRAISSPIDSTQMKMLMSLTSPFSVMRTMVALDVTMRARSAMRNTSLTLGFGADKAHCVGALRRGSSFIQIA